MKSSRFQNVVTKTSIIGLDIGTHSIKCAQFTRKTDELWLVKADFREIPKSGDASQDDAVIAEILKDITAGINIKNSDFILTVNCPQTAVRKVTVPCMPMDELKEALNFEAKNYFHFDVKDAVVDFEIVAESAGNDIKRYELLIATSAMATINRHLTLLRKVGVKPALITLGALAIKNLMTYFESPTYPGGQSDNHSGTTAAPEDQSTSFLDIGEHSCEITIFKGRELMLSRKISIGGQDFTKALMSPLISDHGRIELTFEQAEKIKREVGIPDLNQPGEAVYSEKISAMQMVSLLRSPLELLVSEIGRSFDYYREESRGGRCEYLRLLGGGASLKGLAHFLANELDTKVECERSVAGIKILRGVKEDQIPIHQFALSFGAALSDRRGINLLPVEFKKEKKSIMRRILVQSVFSIIIVSLVLLYVGLRIQLINVQKRIAVTNMQIKSLQPQLQEIKTQSIVNKITAAAPYWEDVFKELSNMIPDNIYLTEITYKDHHLTMKGVVLFEGGTLSDFILNLEKGIFENVKLITTQKMADQKSSTFELGCGLK